LAGMPYTELRDAILIHPTMAERLVFPCPTSRPLPRGRLDNGEALLPGRVCYDVQI
jgi:hypothetical protein